jgi:hypothetical protein
MHVRICLILIRRTCFFSLQIPGHGLFRDSLFLPVSEAFVEYLSPSLE